MRAVPLELKVEWVERYCFLRPHTPFEHVDMAWFALLKFVSTHHHIERQAKRDPAKALHRIQSEKGLHPLFGPPLIAKHVDDDNIIIAAHDVCVIGSLSKTADTFVVITTLPVRPRTIYKTFNSFVKFHCPNSIVKRRRKGPKHSRKLNVDFTHLDHCFKPIHNLRPR